MEQASRFLADVMATRNLPSIKGGLKTQPRSPA